MPTGIPSTRTSRCVAADGPAARSKPSAPSAVPRGIIPRFTRIPDRISLEFCLPSSFADVFFDRVLFTFPFFEVPSFEADPSIASGHRSSCVSGSHPMLRWFNNPHGPPSGVCTGQRKPQLSGSSFLTAVVLICIKKAPRCTLLKWETNLQKFSRSAMMVNPAACIRSRPVRDVMFPVARKVATLRPMPSSEAAPALIPPYRSTHLAQKASSRSELSRVVPLYFEFRCSFMIPTLISCRVSSSLSLTIILIRCPGRSISWFDRESALSTPQPPETKWWSFRTMIKSVSRLSE
mmetsp:Transcript_26951/g.53825  ORF Transcript_26951/g.53825 Transcript_26951/m.53825 type:complete len:292 (-) Transcript_26951:200-1075(-)